MLLKETWDVNKGPVDYLIPPVLAEMTLRK